MCEYETAVSVGGAWMTDLWQSDRFFDNMEQT